MGEAFRRGSRLNNTADFSAIFAQRCVVRSSHLSVFVRPGPPGGRLGLAVSRKLAPRAADRNYMKRLIRETFRRNRDCHPGLDIVVVPRRIFRRGSGQSVASELTHLLQLAGKKCLVSFAH